MLYAGLQTVCLFELSDVLDLSVCLSIYLSIYLSVYLCVSCT